MKYRYYKIHYKVWDFLLRLTKVRISLLSFGIKVIIVRCVFQARKCLVEAIHFHSNLPTIKYNNLMMYQLKYSDYHLTNKTNEF